MESRTCDLLLDEIDPRRGAGHPDAGQDANCGVVLLVGHYAPWKSFPGIISSEFRQFAREGIEAQARPLERSWRGGPTACFRASLNLGQQPGVLGY